MSNLSYHFTWLLIYTAILALVVLILSGCTLATKSADDDWSIKTTTTIEDNDCSAKCDAEVSRTQSREGSDTEVNIPQNLPK